MFNKTTEWFKSLSILGKGIAVVSSSVLAVSAVSAMASPSHVPSVAPVDTAPSAISQQVTEIRTESTTDTIPFNSSTIEDSSLTKGATQVKVSGVAGTKTKTWNVTYTDGIETSRSLKEEVVTTAAVNEVKVLGTYEAPTYVSCPNGTYVNTAGNTVCSPYASNSAPAGATARCDDGSYSFSQSRSGTCSHHGGVSVWL